MIRFLVLMVFWGASCGMPQQAVSAQESGGRSSDAAAFCRGSLSQHPLARALLGSFGEVLDDHWHGWGYQKISERWTLNGDGVLELRPGSKFEELVINGTFRDFVLSFEWSISSGGNSGVKYNVDEASGLAIGFEYQILDDDRHPDAHKGSNANSRKSASLYDLVGRVDGLPLNPPGEFNRGCIYTKGATIEHWLNGQLALRIDLDSQHLKEALQGSKFYRRADFLNKKPGQIFLQDHGDAVSFRKIYLLAL